MIKFRKSGFRIQFEIDRDPEPVSVKPDFESGSLIFFKTGSDPGRNWLRIPAPGPSFLIIIPTKQEIVAFLVLIFVSNELIMLFISYFLS